MRADTGRARRSVAAAVAIAVLVAASVAEAASWDSAVGTSHPPHVNKSWKPTGVNEVTCVSAGNCVAVARYSSTDQGNVSAVFTQRSFRWDKGELVRGPDKAFAESLTLSCPSIGNCTAAGSYAPKGGDAFFASQRKGDWKKGVRAKFPKNYRSFFGARIYGIACVSRTKCAAIGSYATGRDKFATALFTKKKRGWGPGKELKLAAPTGGATEALSCNTAGDYCVTTVAAGSASRYLLAAKNGRWQRPEPLPAEVADVSCRSDGNCGGLKPGGFGSGSPAFYTQSGGQWSGPTPVELPEDAQQGGFESGGFPEFTCFSGGNCIAAGTYATSSGMPKPMVVAQVGGQVQRAITTPLPEGAELGGPLQGAMDCGSPGNCTFVSSYATNDNGTPAKHVLLLDLVNGQWQQGIEAALPGDAASPQAQAHYDFNRGPRLTGIDCVPGGNCTAGGVYADQAGNGQAMFVSRR